jgi:hypothetical protein
VTNVIISREYGKNQKVLPTNGTYRWSLWHRYSITVNHVMVGIFNLFLVKSRDLNIELLTMSSANVWKLSGLELKDILIQQKIIYIMNN